MTPGRVPYPPRYPWVDRGTSTSLTPVISVVTFHSSHGGTVGSTASDPQCRRKGWVPSRLRMWSAGRDLSLQRDLLLALSRAALHLSVRVVVELSRFHMKDPYPVLSSGSIHLWT